MATGKPCRRPRGVAMCAASERSDQRDRQGWDGVALISRTRPDSATGPRLGLPNAPLRSRAAAVATAHRAHFLWVAETAAPHLTAPDQGRWLALLDADQANLQRATAHAAADPDGTTLALRFAVALQRYWMARSRPEEAIRLLGPVLDRPGARADPQLFTEALVAAAFGRGLDMTAALHQGEQAVAATAARRRAVAYPIPRLAVRQLLLRRPAGQGTCPRPGIGRARPEARR